MPALPRRRARDRVPAAGQLGHRRRRGGDRRDRGRAARAATRALQLLGRRRAGRPGHAAAARRARLRAALLRRTRSQRGRPRHGADLGRHRLRPAARLPRLHRARDRRQPRRGGPLAGPRPAAQPLLGHRRRDDGLPRDRGRRPVGVSGGGRPHRARRGVARGAVHGHRGRAVHEMPEPARRRRCRSTSASPPCSSWSRRRRRRSPASPAWPTRSASTACSRARSAGSTGGRSWRRARSSPRRSSRRTLLVGAAVLRPSDEVASLASLYSFGVLLAFSAAQLAVIWLRITQPELRRPFRVPLNLRLGYAEIPVPTRVGFALTLTVWVVALSTHPGARYAGPAWLALGLVVYVTVRRSLGDCRSSGASRRATSGACRRPATADPRADEDRPDRRGDGADGGQAGPGERRRACEALFVDPRAARPAARGGDGGGRGAGAAARSRRRALLAADHGVEVGRDGAARALDRRRHRRGGRAAGRRPRRARLAPALAPAVALLLADGRHVLRRAPCEVVIVVFPQGVLEEDAASTAGAAATLTP